MFVTVGHTVLHMIEASDHRLMQRVHTWSAPRWVQWWMVASTRAGDGWLWYSLCALTLLLGGPERFSAVVAASLAAFTGVIAFLLLKRLCGRTRPCHIQPHCWSRLLPPDQFSFPSGHTITAFAVSIPFMGFYPGLIVPLLFLAISVALSRVLLGMHFLSDVLAGAAIGSGLGYISYRLLV
jgi:undecaprenyl-diphosphatase